ncbi:hypothetical protein ACNUDN_11505 [Mycobacterium sp. smrl_JER01]|uniref:hypothetical protein n=1 Tax=Mycobacterium sp. smrl_JER01 TaxID=3402633 RepID=UPI003AC8FBF1
MTGSGAGEVRAYPAPGSAVPGAPPPLKRALTPSDGVVEAPPSSANSVKDTAVQCVTADYRVGDGPRLAAAAAMLGMALGLELAALRRRPRRRQMLT